MVGRVTLAACLPGQAPVFGCSWQPPEAAQPCGHLSQLQPRPPPTCVTQAALLAYTAINELCDQNPSINPATIGVLSQVQSKPAALFVGPVGPNQKVAIPNGCGCASALVHRCAAPAGLQLPVAHVAALPCRPAPAPAPAPANRRFSSAPARCAFLRLSYVSVGKLGAKGQQEIEITQLGVEFELERSVDKKTGVLNGWCATGAYGTCAHCRATARARSTGPASRRQRAGTGRALSLCAASLQSLPPAANTLQFAAPPSPRRRFDLEAEQKKKNNLQGQLYGILSGEVLAPISVAPQPKK